MSEDKEREQMATTKIIVEKEQVAQQQVHEVQEKGMLDKILDLLKLVFTIAVLPWGIWVTNTIYLHQQEIKECKTWRGMRPEFATKDAVDLKLLQNEKEQRQWLNLKMDSILSSIAGVDAMASPAMNRP